MHPPAPCCRFNHDFSVFFSCAARLPHLTSQILHGQNSRAAVGERQHCTNIHTVQSTATTIPKKNKKNIMIDQSQLHNPSLTSPCLTSPPKFPHSQLPVTLRPPQTTKLTHPPTHLISSDGFQPPHQPTNQLTKTIKKTTYYILP